MEQTRGRTGGGAAVTTNPLRRSLSATTTSASTVKSPEVRCACQYYRSYSLLPERSALLAANKRPPLHTAAKAAANANSRRPAAGRTVWRPAAGNNNNNRQRQQQLQLASQQPSSSAAMGDNEYEPVGQPVVRLALSSSTVAVRMVAPVVKITDTAVADSDDSIEDRYRFQQRALILDGDVIVPLDGSIEDNAMAGKNLGDQTIDTLGDEEELSSASSSRPQISGAHRQHNFELAAAIKEARQEAETRKQSLIDEAAAAASVESPIRRGARDFQQRLKNQAGRIHSRLSSIQKPTFGRRAKTPTMAKPMKPKPKTMAVPPSPRAEQKASRLERFRMALPERPKFHLPDKSKFHLPDKSKFHLPERPKFNLPDRPKFNMPDTSKLRSHLKKPNIQMPKSFNRVRRSASQRVTKTQDSGETAATTEERAQQRRSIFDFSTYPRPKIFERKAKAKASGDEFATSSPKESRAQSTESWSTFPRVKKAGQSLVARWSQRFGDTAPQHHFPEPEGSVERSRPWRHPSLEEPRLSLKPQTSQDDEQMPWETASRKNYDLEEASVPLEEDEDRSYGASLKVVHTC